MRARSFLLVVALIGSAGIGGTSAGQPQAAAPAAQRVVMFTDSVGLGARGALPRAFPSDWVVNVDGQPARFVEQLENDFVKPRLATNPDWFGDHVVIAGGYNYPYWDPERFERSIDSMIATLTGAGVKHIHWVTLREVKPEYISAAAWRQVQPYYWYFPEVNDHLEAALERHPNLRLVDWAAVADRTGITYDAIHLNTTGAELYSQIIRESVDAAATSVADRSVTRVSVPDAVGDVAAAINITTTHPRRQGHLRVWDCDGEPPTVSMHSFQRAQTIAHAGIVPLNAAGEFCVFARTSTNLVIDVTGTFTDAAGLDPTPPTRLLDTRDVGTPIRAGDTAEVANTDVGPMVWAMTVTALGGNDPGWLRTARCEDIDRLDTATVNHPVADPTPNLALVATNDDEAPLCVRARSATHAIVDLFGFFTAVDEFEVGTPIRWLDTRDDGDPLPAGSTVELDLADHPEFEIATDSGAAAIINISSIGATEPGFVTGYPCDATRPTTANLNTQGGVVSNAAVLPVDADGRLCLYNRSTMHIVVDLSGFISDDAFNGAAPMRVLDTRE